MAAARPPGADALLTGEAGGVIAARLLQTLAAWRGAQPVVLHRGEELVLNVHDALLSSAAAVVRLALSH